MARFLSLMLSFLSLMLLVLLAGAITHASPPPISPYADIAQRTLKALSPTQAKQLLAGHGMGMALPAELNGYPGPKHVLELAEQLALEPAQVLATEQLYQRMLEEAQRLGKQLLDEEQTLENLFANRTVQASQLDRQLQHIGLLRARLRAAHLTAHIEQTQLLTDQQVAAYQRLRGYSESIQHDGTEHHHKHLG